MKATNVPAPIPEPFGKNATAGITIRTIPQTTADPNAASYDLGFPPNTFIPEGSGGQPPDGRDVNGILYVATSWDQWLQAGGPLIYNATFAGDIGGYPKGALIASATFGTYWLSTADDNLTDPDTGGADWVGLMLTNNYAVDSGTANAIAATFDPMPASLAAMVGLPVLVKVANANTVSNPTVTFGAFSTLTITNSDGSALRPGQIAVGAVIGLVYDGTRAQLIGGATPNVVPATGGVLQYNSGSQLQLAPISGGQLWINGFNYAVPAALYLAASGLTAATFYYVYAYISGGNMTLEASATGYTVAANGIPQKTGDATRTLVGACYVATGPAFASSDTQMFVMSYFNRSAHRGLGVFTSNHVLSAGTTYAEVDVEIRVSFIAWATEVVEADLSGTVVNGAINPQTAIGFDSANAEDGYSSGQQSQPNPFGIVVQKIGLSEAASHYATVLGSTVNSGGNLTYDGSATQGKRTALYLRINQ